MELLPQKAGIADRKLLLDYPATLVTFFPSNSDFSSALILWCLRGTAANIAGLRSANTILFGKR